MAKNRGEIIADIDFVIGELSAPLSSAERAFGWREESKNAVRLFFLRLKDDVKSGKMFESLSISRSLDTWGVTGGELLEKAVEISNYLRSLTADDGRAHRGH